ncbi:hypothetical protein Ndes2437B_g03711 [Nannochloris sp. 'desiccata']
MPLNALLLPGDVARCPTLRFGTHNVRGLTLDNIPRFTQMWDELHLGIVFIQEHWIPSVVHSVPFANKFSRRPHGRGWTVFWRYKTTSISASTAPSSTATPSEELDDSTISAGRSRGGVAIAIRTSLIRDGTVRLISSASLC